MDILLDSAAYIDIARSGQDPRQVLSPYLQGGQLYNCGIVRAEFLRGIKAPKQHQDVLDFFDIVPEVPCDARLWRQVSEIGWELGRKGRWPPVTDIAIAACAMRVNAMLISTDAHFKDITGLKLQSKLPKI